MSKKRLKNELYDELAKICARIIELEKSDRRSFSADDLIGADAINSDAKELIRALVTIDPLTGLSNFATFKDRAQEAMDRCDREDEQMAVFFLDLDHFSDINDDLGHTEGDKLLKMTAERLTKCTRKIDHVARMGGDEFLMLAPGIDGAQDAGTLAHRISRTLAKPFSIAGKEVSLTCSVGIVLYPFSTHGVDGLTDPQSLIKHAAMTAEQVKDLGRNGFQFYDSKISEEVTNRIALERDLSAALENQELLLYYQPKANIITGEVFGMEALIRWEHPTRGLISPMDFIPIAESSGLIHPIGSWVIREACRQNKEFMDNGLPPLRVSVNVSAEQFRKQNLIEVVKSALGSSQLDPVDLELELTETMLMHDPELAVVVLTKLHKFGVSLSLDDFGTGYSSLSALRRFPLDVLKIDRSFVKDLSDNQDDNIIARAIIRLGHSLGMTVIAEGVESEEHMTFLAREGCDEIQGYLLSRPIPPAEFEQLIRDRVAAQSLKNIEVDEISDLTSAG